MDASGTERIGEDRQEENSIHRSGDHPTGFNASTVFHSAMHFSEGHWMPPGRHGYGLQGTVLVRCLSLTNLLIQASDIEVGVVSKTVPQDALAAGARHSMRKSDQVQKRLLPAIGS